MTSDIFGSLHKLQDARLDTLGDLFTTLATTIDWESFRLVLERVHHKRQQ